MPKRCQFQLHRQLDGLFETVMKKRQVVFAEVPQDPKVWAIHLRDIHECQVLPTPFFYFTGAEYTMTVGVDQDTYDQLGWVGMLSKVMVLLFNFRGINVLEDGLIDVAVMIFGKKIKDVGWKQQVLVELNRAILEFWWWRHQASSGLRFERYYIR
ncbi:hypothetical protein NX722_03120 [Endozoicomonas gorgoniicola]|uniref:Uncharacterized protein n=1 Tax=Endozoicomonas gorgoniicola TaxID=1234144 RepID=A0ABT3MQJ5_9GAMM|nr:hypothetical protein [Endozoicomonas gorgoniicola]MCW7551651.1 hypothetical protein [Endozoicomonas gorgoniicola]